jgi:hypothetical protein
MNLVFGSACCLPGFRQLRPGRYPHYHIAERVPASGEATWFAGVKWRAVNRGHCVEIRFVDLGGFVADSTFPNYSRSPSARRLQARLVSRSFGSPL